MPLIMNTSLKFIFFNKFGFRIGTLNPNKSKFVFFLFLISTFNPNVFEFGERV